MKLFPKSRDPKQQIRKKGRAVDNRYCSHMKQPPFTPKTKECRKQNCALPKWELGPWSKVSSIAAFVVERLLQYGKFFIFSVRLAVEKAIQLVNSFAH